MYIHIDKYGIKSLQDIINKSLNLKTNFERKIFYELSKIIINYCLSNWINSLMEMC